MDNMLRYIIPVTQSINALINETQKGTKAHETALQLAEQFKQVPLPFEITYHDFPVGHNLVEVFNLAQAKKFLEHNPKYGVQLKAH